MRERIAVTPHIHFGKPCVADTRITVESVLELVREGIAPVDIRRDYYPESTAEDVRACVQHAIDSIAQDDRPRGPRTAEQRAELARRDVELEANPGIALTWEWIRVRVEAKP